MRRRTFLKTVGGAAAAALAPGCGGSLTRGDGGDADRPDGGFDGDIDADWTADADRPRPDADDGGADGDATPAGQPNILIIFCDQMREPCWYPEFDSAEHLPNLAALREQGVTFGHHYIAATPCSPSRASFTTGLYSHQHGILLNVPEVPELDARFPTFGRLLREHFGYSTAWFGKWHLGDATHGDFDVFDEPARPGGPVEGTLGDPVVVDRFVEWIGARPAAEGPFCAAVSLNNPHDICYVGDPGLADVSVPPVTDGTALHPPLVFSGPSALPPNWESDLSSKSRLQQYGRGRTRLPVGDPSDPAVHEVARDWPNLYHILQRYVDYQIGRVLEALESSGFADSTVVIFSSDHGDHCASHGLGGKRLTGYQEVVRVPFIVRDPTGWWVRRPGEVRQALTSHVDVAPMLFTLASGGDEWRSRAEFAHVARRHDLVAILADPAATGRPYILSAGDKPGPTPPDSGSGPIPNHVLTYLESAGMWGGSALRKLVTTSLWGGASGMEILRGAENADVELYNHETGEGRLELQNLAAGVPHDESPVSSLLGFLHGDAIPRELREPLEDPDLAAASIEALMAYLRLDG